MSFITNIDINILQFIQNYLTNPHLDRPMISLSACGDMGLIWICFTIIFLTTKEYRTMGKVAVVSLILDVIIINILIKPMVNRIRPFNLVEGIQLLVPKPTDYSFPSGHTAASFCVLLVILKMSKSKWLKIFTSILAVSIAYSRLYLFVHYPTDVLCGAVFGSLIGIFSVYLYKKGYLDKIFNFSINRKS